MKKNNLYEKNDKLLVIEEYRLKTLTEKDVFNIFYETDSRIIYVVDERKLTGIITLGAFIDSLISKKCEDFIQRNFCSIQDGNFVSDAASIMKEKKIATAVPVCDKNGRLLYEIRRYQKDEFEKLRDLQAEFYKYKNSKYLRDECVYLKKMLEEQRIIILGDEDQLWYFFGDLFENAKEIKYVKEIKDPYLFLENRDVLFLDLQTKLDGGKAYIYKRCSNGYSWDGFWNEILQKIQQEFFTKRFVVLQNGFYDALVREYREGKLEISTNSIIFDYIKNNSHEVCQRMVLKKGLIRNSELRMNICLYGGIQLRVNNNEFDSAMNNAYLDTQIELMYQHYKEKVLVFYINEKYNMSLSKTEKERMYAPNCDFMNVPNLHKLYSYDDVEERFKAICKESYVGKVRTVENNLLLHEEQRGRYINIDNGLRITSNQPKEYIGTIYIYGLCTVFGSYVEDKHTIPSWIQKKLNENTILYRVVNLGNVLPINLQRFFDSIELKENDLLVCLASFTTPRFLKEVKAIDITKKFEERKCSMQNKDCFVDLLSHPGEYGSKIYADVMFDEIAKCLNVSEEIKIRKNNIYALLNKDMSDMELLYGFESYLKEIHKFDSCIPTSAKCIGAIVMNCNPFTKGHRFLIEYAAKSVDFLYVFVVEEDRSFFKFEDRLEMVRRGTKDLPNVAVIRSGKMILSNITFSAYFTKEEKIAYQTKIPPTTDLRIFAQYVAEEFRIMVRFVGEEPNDVVTRQYNECMKEMLPQFGIQVVEIQRKEEDGEVISASRVREYYKANNVEEVEKLVPQTTLEFLVRKGLKI